VSLTALTKAAAKQVSKAANVVFKYMVELTRALNEARIRDSRMSASYW
jgi:hypothetical protein